MDPSFNPFTEDDGMVGQGQAEQQHQAAATDGHSPMHEQQQGGDMTYPGDNPEEYQHSFSSSAQHAQQTYDNAEPYNFQASSDQNYRTSNDQPYQTSNDQNYQTSNDQYAYHNGGVTQQEPSSTDQQAAPSRNYQTSSERYEYQNGSATQQEPSQTDQQTAPAQNYQTPNEKNYQTLNDQNYQTSNEQYEYQNGDATQQQQQPASPADPNTVSLTQTPQSNDDDRKQVPNETSNNNGEGDDDDDDDDDVIEILSEDESNPQPTAAKRARYDANAAAVPNNTAGMVSVANRAAAMPGWIANNPNSVAAGYGAGATAINPGHTMNSGMNGYNQTYNMGYNTGYGYPQQQQQPPKYYVDPSKLDKPEYIEMPKDFVPTWKTLIPDTVVTPPKPVSNQKKAYQLSLLNLTEFTITGLPISHYYDAPPTPIAGLRAVIKRISREHGQATFEKDAGGVGGRWKIPIGAYHTFVAYLNSDPNCIRLETIPELQLKIASLGKARLEKDYPTPEQLIQRGVPLALANTLAPFQRGGVDFVLEREGRALIADDMGLGKTIQSIASMSVYHKQWPLLVLTPSGARYHWESEFRNWLGEDGAAAKKAEEMGLDDEKPKATVGNTLTGGTRPFKPLRNSQIHVLTSSKGPVIPNKNVRIVICSYGLAPMLAESRRLTPGMFQCAIADESHMMKNSKSKRTKFLLPILKNCSRCILLSGTPAMAKPIELWPQLQILATEKNGFWDNEEKFFDKYVKNGSAARRAELHTMLTGTLMIRRLKADILKDMPKKAREKALIKVESPEMRNQMQECLKLLREGKGVMAKLARQHHGATNAPAMDDDLESSGPVRDATASEQIQQSFDQLLNGARPITPGGAEAALEQEMLGRYRQKQFEFQQHIMQTATHQYDDAQVREFLGQSEFQLRNELHIEYQERIHDLRATQDKPTRATVLNKMYSLTGESKIPAVSKFLTRWLGDRAKGKICVFAHHISVLDAVAERVGLSNSGEAGTFKFIRIDGKTSPKSRQEQIDRFQTDPSVKVAMLGITAAGVAVTLTASSHVLFAELFWTPALMIQAEDRCHRIGQRAKVHCKYFVATGTLDDILWKLIEKKFREIGEFVEGKEKLQISVNRVYQNEEQLYSIFENNDDEEGDDDDEVLKAEASEPEILPLDGELEHDIEEFGKQELSMVMASNGDEEDGEPETGAIAQQNRLTPVVEEDNGPGTSHEDAIALSDSDDDDDEVEASVIKAIDLETPNSDLNVAGALPQCRFYKLLLKGPQLGVQIGIYKERIMVSRKMPYRLQKLGNDAKPDVGDILVGVDESVMPPLPKLEPALNYLKKRLRHSKPLTLWFAEDDEFKEFYKRVNVDQRLKAKPRPTDEVVELLDD